MNTVLILILLTVLFLSGCTSSDGKCVGQVDCIQQCIHENMEAESEYYGDCMKSLEDVDIRFSSRMSYCGAKSDEYMKELCLYSYRRS